MEEKNIKRKECRLVYHIPAIEDVRPDIHYIQELITYEDNTTKKYDIINVSTLNKA